ncbi:ATP-grasp domain-containing protein [Neobacillus drentensis]|uniref:ATP-grasp domain-containing protein n=1 Tax=Neobacillus drentensis TaxID=220684 RepID=UPI002FFDF99E
MNVIIVGCHKGLTRGVIKSLINSKIKFSFIGTKEIIKSVSLSKLCKSFYEINEKDLDIDSKNLNEIIMTLIKDHDDNYVIPTGIRSTLYISKYAKVIAGKENHYPLSDYQTLAMLNNKWNFFSFLMKHNFPSPKTFLLDSIEMQHINDNLSFPVITKPLDSENSINVIRSDNLTELCKLTSSSPIPLLVQEYIPGYDIDLSIFSIEGTIKAWTIFRRTEKGILFESNKEVLQIGEQIVNTLNFSGLINFDLRFNEQNGKFMVIECNPRVWGSMLHSTYVGVNYMDLAINNQNHELNFNAIKSGTISLNKSTLIKKLFKPSLTRQDFKSIFIQTKLFFHDPFYEISFFRNNK